MYKSRNNLISISSLNKNNDSIYFNENEWFIYLVNPID